MLRGGVGSNDEDTPSDDTEPTVTDSRQAVSIASLANESAEVIVPSEDGSPECAGKEVGVDTSLDSCAGDGPLSSIERTGVTGVDALLVFVSRYK